MPKCICTTVCDCQNPPPDDWNGVSGVWHISEECPVHNERPLPHPECVAQHSVRYEPFYGTKF